MCHWTADYCISVKFPLRRWPFILLKQWLHNMQCTTWAKIVWLSSDHRLENILLLGQNLYRALTEFSSLIVGLYHTEIDSAHSNSGSTRQYKGGNKRRNKNRRQGRQSQEDLPFLSCIWGKNRKERGLPFMTSALRGVPSKADIVSNLSKGGCVNLRTRGEGVKKSETCADVLNGSPQRRMTKKAPPPIGMSHPRTMHASLRDFWMETKGGGCGWDSGFVPACGVHIRCCDNLWDLNTRFATDTNILDLRTRYRTKLAWFCRFHYGEMANFVSPNHIQIKLASFGPIHVVF